MKKQINFLILLLSVILVNAQEDTTVSTKPNILFIAIDDLKPTIGSYGDTFAITPNMDKLSENGTVFMNNHAQQAICGPSRASVLTGKRPDYTKVRDLETKMRDVHPNIHTIPQYFKENGYITAATGKIYDFRCIDEFGDKPSWTIPYIQEDDLEYPEGYGKPVLAYYQNEAIKKRFSELIAEAKSKGIEDGMTYAKEIYKPPFETSDAPDEAYRDGAIAKHAMQLLDTVSKDSKPFFLGVGFKRPHLPFVASQKYWDLYDRDKIKIAASQKRVENGVEIAYHNSFEILKYKTHEIDYIVKNGLLELDPEIQKKLIHGYYASVSFVDTQIGKIMDKLKEKGLDKNTIIVLWGDHGWHLGDHSMWNKHSNFEQATRSPLIIYAPNTNKKQMNVTSPTELLDIFPTLCELSHLKIPNHLDGTSLFSIMNGTTKQVKPYAVSQYPRGKNTGYSFRTDRYRYTVWLGYNKKSTDTITNKDILAQELYDYKNDPLETINIFGDKKHKNIQKNLVEQSLAFFKTEARKASETD